MAANPRVAKVDNDYNLNMHSSKKSEFISFLDKVLRIQMSDKLINSSMEEMEISPKKMRMNEEEMSSDSIDSGEDFIWLTKCYFSFKAMRALASRSTARSISSSGKDGEIRDDNSSESTKTPSKSTLKLKFPLFYCLKSRKSLEKL